jgi:HAD superfamily hydrolase (TIGR01509 family)
MNNGIDAIVFDLNGVLVDGSDWHEKAFTKAMSDYNCCATSDFKKGCTTLQRLYKLYKIKKAPDNFRDIEKQKFEYFKELINLECKPIDRIINAVSFAKDYTNNNIAVVTNCSRKSSIEMLTSSGLISLFNTIITSDDVRGKLKPEPLPYLTASYILDIQSKRCLAIDDSDIGIMSAINAGFKTLRIRNFEELNEDLIKRKLKSLEVRL